jgi:FMN phosphatase YigB (HAD superfamily)
MAGGQWATFDCYGTLVDWLGGMRAAIASVAPDRADRLLAVYHEEEPEVQAEGFRRYRDVLAEAWAGAPGRPHRGPGARRGARERRPGTRTGERARRHAARLAGVRRRVRGREPPA